MKINKKYKLWEATAKDDFRPIFEYIFFQDGFAYATTGHVLIKVSINLLFEVNPMDPEDQLSLLNGYCIHAELYKKLTGYGQVWFEQVEGRTHINVLFEQQKVSIALKNSEEIKPLAFEKVLQFSGSREPVEAFGVNPYLLVNLAHALGVDKGVKLTFTKKGEKIFVEPANEEEGYPRIGLIMPIYIG